VMSEPVFECRSASVVLSLSSGPRPIISDINLEVRDAEFLSIVGPSGTGKTTLLRVLGGLLRPTSGEVLIKGRVMTGPPEDVVIVFQDYANALLQWRTVRDNVAFGIERKLTRAECADRVNDALSLVGLLERADDYPWQLSGGMQQRVQIARAIAHRPKVLFLDEPSAGLDPQSRIAMWEAVRGLREEGITVVLTTHYMEEADELCDRLAIMDHGKILALGTPAELKRSTGADTIVTVKAAGELDMLHVLIGILPTMYDARSLHVREAVEILEENFGDLVFRTRIRKTIRYAEAPVKGMSVLRYEPKGLAAEAYRSLAEEVLEREQT